MFLIISSNKVLDNLKLNFDDNSLWAMYIALAIIMFGVSLEITIDNFKRLSKKPKLVLIGVFSQFLLFPLITFALVNIINPIPSIALGMILVAACPGGNISNFLTHLSGGNTALSVSLTAFATLVAIVMTPLNLQFWGNLYEPTSQILRDVELNPFELAKLVTLILGVPLLLGMLFRKRNPTMATKIAKVLKPVSVVILMLFIAVAFYNNLDIFTEYIHYVIFIVILHNFSGLLGGFYFAKGLKLPYYNQKTLALETGIQNSGLGLLLVFAFFDGLGGMALCVAFWGIWDILSGLVIAYYWSKTSPETVKSSFNPPEAEEVNSF